MVHYRSLETCYSCFSVLCVWALATLVAAPAGAETISLSQEAFQRAKQVTVGILADTQDQRMSEKLDKISVRGTGVHLRDGYVVTARHAAEKHDPTTGTIIQKRIRILTSDLHELPPDLVGDSAFMDVVLYRVVEPHRSKLQAGTTFVTGDVMPGMEVFTVGYPLGWGPTMAFALAGGEADGARGRHDHRVPHIRRSRKRARREPAVGRVRLIQSPGRVHRHKAAPIPRPRQASLAPPSSVSDTVSHLFLVPRPSPLVPLFLRFRKFPKFIPVFKSHVLIFPLHARVPHRLPPRLRFPRPHLPQGLLAVLLPAVAHRGSHDPARSFPRHQLPPPRRPGLFPGNLLGNLPDALLHPPPLAQQILAYHLWKFGVVGSTLFVLPVAAMARQALRVPSPLRSTVIGGAVSVLVYLVTAASYKSYFLVPMIGVVVGASLRIVLPGAGEGAATPALLPAEKAPSVGRA